MVYQTRRDTLAFDYALYKDRFIEVTPCVLVIRRFYFPFFGKRTVAITDIEKIWQGCDPELSSCSSSSSSDDVGFSKVWWADLLGRERSDPRKNFVLRMRRSNFFGIGFSTECPRDAYNAICNAMQNNF